MSRFARVAASMVVTLALLPALVGAQEDMRAETDTAFARLQAKMMEVNRTPVAERARGYQELFAHCTVFLDAYLQHATQEQLMTTGGLWLMLSKQLNQPAEAIRARIAAFRALPRLPDRLVGIIRSAEARLDLRAGVTAPDWTANDLDGNAMNLIAMRGKLVLMCFYGTYCVPSKEQLDSRVAPLHARYRDDPRLAIVGIGVPFKGETADKQRQFAREWSYTFPKVFDQGSTVCQTFGVDGTPYFVLIDEEGKILVMGPGGPTMEQADTQVRQKLGEPQGTR